MAERILVTGGGGFIGSFLVDSLVEQGHSVRIYDALVPQVHGPEQALPDYVNLNAEFIRGDVRDREALARALKGMDVVFHLAAAVGVGQSMYQIQYYTEANTLGGAVLLDLLANTEHQVRKVLVASSMSIYGEGKYECVDHGVVFPRLRTESQLRTRDWEMKCPHCGQDVRSLPTDEEKPLFPTSIYAITKRDHEEMFLSTGLAYGIPAVALRFFNTYGPRQALSNPYTGVAAIFSGRLLNRQPPIIYEDGQQSRDFIHVKDIVQGLLLAMDKPEADYQVFNLGTGTPTSIGEVARLLSEHLVDGDIEPHILNQFRAGDIRHCYADVSKARSLLGFEPQISFGAGMADLLAWVQEQTAVDRFDQVEKELAVKSLVV
ncbi:MAG TPA: NAD-dependent epimerase/dehydratase family protein [Anaerolineae bacterium]|nr:NAD-dependent epimerase/dehydratase family protein [Anaerolineae bacterium]